jgi:hypothetical protein
LGELEELRKLVKDHERRIARLESSQSDTKLAMRENSKRRKSITDLLIELKDDGFFKEPQFATQIVDRLAQDANHYEPDSLNWPLQNAVKKRILGRKKIDDKWAYVNR